MRSPVVGSIIFFDERPGTPQIMGIAAGVLAFVLLGAAQRNKGKQGGLALGAIGILLAIFAIVGSTDFSMLFIGFILFFITMLFLRGKIERVSTHISANLMKCFGAGVLSAAVGLFGLLIVMIPLIITIVGIPLALLLAVSCLGVYVIACTSFVFSVGRAVATRAGIESGPFVHLFLGVLLLSIPEIIAFVIDTLGHAPMAPYVLFKIISAFVWLFAYVVGLRAIVVSRFGSRPVEPTPPSPRTMGEPAVAPVS